VGALLAPHPQGPQPSALGDFSVPTAEEGRAIPVVFGTCLIKGGNTVWWGDLKSKAIKVGGGILSLGKTQTTGYRYFLGCQFMLCHGPIDSLIDIQADGREVPGSQHVVNNGDGSENYIEFDATGDKLFGGTGPGGGGGISGTINVYRGLQTQQPDAYLGQVQGRVVTDQSGIGYDFAGVGNGGISSLSAGAESLEETFTITFNSIDTNSGHSTFGKAKFDIVGSVSGTITNSVANSDGSHALWADQAFSSDEINLTIVTGSTQYQAGDTFTIKTLHSHVAPAYRGLCYAVFKQLYVGTSNYLKPLAFQVKRCPKPAALTLIGQHDISGDANPACVVYDLLSNADYGLGIDPVRIDSVSFRAAAITLATEQLGISMMFDQQASADQLLGEVLRHCDGVLYTDPQTGLWMLKLARADYDPATIPTLDVSSVIGTPDFSRGSWRETTNLVNIKYSSRAANFDDRSIRAYDRANILATGEVRPQDIDFKGLSNATSAGLVAMRVLKTLTYPLAKMKIVADRSAWQFRPGGVFKFTWTPLGISNQVFRITRIGYGELIDGKISMDVVEDIFGINSTAFVSPPTSGWVDPVGFPTPITAERMIEVPYLILVREALPVGIFALAIASRDPSIDEKNFDIFLNPGSGFSDTGIVGSFCPSGVLDADYHANSPALDSTGFTLSATGAVDLDTFDSISDTDFGNGVTLALVDDEIMAVRDVTLLSNGKRTYSHVIRGLLDTLPADHTAGARVYFFSYGAQTTSPTPAAADLTVTARLCPNTGIGQLPVSSASDLILATNSRAVRPYPPGNISVNGAAYGVRPANCTGDLTVSWASRNRLTQGLLVQQDAGDVPPEAGTTYQVQKKIAGVAVGGPINIGGSESFTYSAAARGADDPDFTKLTTLEISSVNGAGPSYFAVVINIHMFGSATTLPSPGRYEFPRVRVGGIAL
jgi:hypothetical protein